MTSTALELLAAALDNPGRAALLLGLAANLREPLGTLRGAPEQSLLERTLEGTRRCRGDNEFTSIFDGGRATDTDEAMAEAASEAQALRDKDEVPPARIELAHEV